MRISHKSLISYVLRGSLTAIIMSNFAGSSEVASLLNLLHWKSTSLTSARILEQQLRTLRNFGEVTSLDVTEILVISQNCI